MKLIRPAQIVNNDMADGGPDYMVIEITEEKIQRYEHLTALAQKVGVDEMQEYGGGDFFEGEPEEHDENCEAMRTEIDREHITQRGYIFWSAFEKHSNIQYEANGMYLEDLKELFQVSESKLEDLPLLINTLKTDGAKALLKKRLGGEED